MATKRTTTIALLLAAIGVVFRFSPAAAVTFNPAAIISNSEFFNYNSLAQKDISYFLNQKGSYLAGYSVTVNGTTMSAAKIIYNAAHEYRINPKVILVTLQKEQSLITSSSPSQRALDYAMGYGCPDGGGCKSTTAGFFKQIDYATWQLRQYADHSNNYHFRPGQTYTFNDGCSGKPPTTTVTITNQATANLYNYTPHVYCGNYNFWKNWLSWFTIQYPDGSLLNPEGEPGIWLIQDGKKYPFHSKSAFLSRYDLSKVITVPASVLDAYPLGSPIKYPDLSLLQAPSGGIYLILEGKRYAVTSREIFQQLGFSFEEVFKVSWDELNAYPEGSKITSINQAPTGQLMQSTATGAIYYVESSIRHAIHSKEILRSRFRYQRWIRVPQSQLDRYAKGGAVKFRDGELVASPNSNGVYLISNGQRRPIPSMEVFNGMGYQWYNIVWSSDRALKVHPLGERVTLFSL